MQSRATIDDPLDDPLLDAVLLQLARCTRQGHLVPATKLAPYMARLCEVLVELVNTPDVVLVVLLVFGVDCVQFADRTRWCKQRRVEKTREAFESAS